MDRANGLRGRYRAALRLDGEGQDLLALERELDFAARREASRAELLERYRHVRARLDPSRLASVSARDVAAVLEPGEAVVALRFHFAGSVAVAVAPGDETGLLLEDFGARQWLELFASGEEFLTALVEPWAGVDPEPGLAQILAGVDDLLGDWLRELVAKHGLRRLTLVPDRMLHLIPWAALPSLRGIDVVIAPSVSEAIRVRSRAGAVPRDALVVANPTLDLRVSACGVRAGRRAPDRRRLRGLRARRHGGERGRAARRRGELRAAALRRPRARRNAWRASSCIHTSPATRSASGSSAPRTGASPRPRTTTRGSSGSRTCRMPAGSSSGPGSTPSASTAGSSTRVARSSRHTAQPALYACPSCSRPPT